MKTIGYLSFDASVKIHESGRYASTKTNKTGYGGIEGYIRHIDRETDRRNGCEVNHTNPDINADLTLENESFFRNELGLWEKTEQSKDMSGAVKRRIQYAKEHGARIAKVGKNDTVIARPIVIQMDAELVESHKDCWHWDVIEVLEEMFGEENVVGFSIHRDETNVHVHVIFVPCVEKTKADGKIKCAISQTKFFRNPRELAGMHRKMRKELNEKGYDIQDDKITFAKEGFFLTEVSIKKDKLNVIFDVNEEVLSYVDLNDWVVAIGTSSPDFSVKYDSEKIATVKFDSSDVHVDTKGEYVLTYEITDANNKKIEKNVLVTVVEKETVNEYVEKGVWEAQTKIIINNNGLQSNNSYKNPVLKPIHQDNNKPSCCGQAFL